MSDRPARAPTPLAPAAAVAGEICGDLASACERIEIAGSIRRRAPFVGDIEIVCQPRLIPDPATLIGGEMVSALDRKLADVIRRPGARLRFDPELQRNGPRYKRLEFSDPVAGNLKVDLFAVLPPASWGAIMAIRTGPATFSRLLVTRRSYGGALPDSLEQRDGALWANGTRIDTPEESDFFAALELPFLPVEDRSWNYLKKLLAKVL